MNIFVDIHTQVDLCVKSGNLRTMDQATLDSCEDLVNYAVRNKTLIIGSVETNDFTKRYCIKGEMGWLKTNETSVKRSIFVPNVKLADEQCKNILKAATQGVYFETTKLADEKNCLFSNPNVFTFFENLLKNNAKIIFFGTNFEDALFNSIEEFVVFASKNSINLSVLLAMDACSFGSEEVKQARINALKALSQKYSVPVDYSTTVAILNELRRDNSPLL